MLSNKRKKPFRNYICTLPAVEIQCVTTNIFHLWKAHSESTVGTGTEVLNVFFTVDIFVVSLA